MSASLFLAAVLAVVSVGVWVVGYLSALAATRPAHPEPAPSTPDLGPEPPAVASLLACGWVLTEDAAEATLIDLAARHYLEFRQPGNDPRQTTVHVRDPGPPGLNRYEQMILDRVASLATGGVVPLTALTFRDPAQAKGFRKRVEAAVIADCRARGLSRRRFGPATLTVLNALAVVCGFGLAAAVMLMPDSKNAHPSIAVGAGAWLLGAGVLIGFANRPIGERDTPAGRQACARWLGVKTWLRNTEEFANLPPAAVTVWDRYLAYGAALGATRLASGVIDLGMGNRRRVWSSFGGTWHRVRVRYPNFWRRYGRPTSYFVIQGLLVLLAGVVFVRIPGGGVVRLVGVLLLGYGLYVLVRGIADAASPVTVTGQVLWRETWRSKSQSENDPIPWLHYLAVDDGAGDSTTAWGVPSEWVERCGDGDTVRISVRRWSRRVVNLDVVARSQASVLAAANPVSAGTETLIAAELGVSTIRGAGGSPLSSAEQLLTTDEVSRAVGTAVTMRGISSPHAKQTTDSVVRFETSDGRTLVTLVMAGGTAGKIAMMTQRRNPPLPGMGDEAYGGDRSAVARRGGVVVSLSTRTSPHPIDPRHLHGLLSVAMSRLSPSGTPPGEADAAGQRAVP